MAHYCIKPKKAKKCKYLYTGMQIGTDRALCNVFTNTKPCETGEGFDDNFITKIKKLVGKWIKK